MFSLAFWFSRRRRARLGAVAERLLGVLGAARAARSGTCWATRRGHRGWHSSSGKAYTARSRCTAQCLDCTALWDA